MWKQYLWAAVVQQRARLFALLAVSSALVAAACAASVTSVGHPAAGGLHMPTLVKTRVDVPTRVFGNPFGLDDCEFVGVVLARMQPGVWIEGPATVTRLRFTPAQAAGTEDADSEFHANVFFRELARDTTAADLCATDGAAGLVAPSARRDADDMPVLMVFCRGALALAVSQSVSAFGSGSTDRAFGQLISRTTRALFDRNGHGPGLIRAMRR